MTPSSTHRSPPPAIPLPGDPPSADELARQTARFGAALGKGSRERLRGAVQALYRHYERTVAAHPPKQTVACRKGCAFCCHLYVSATAPELLVLADHIARWPDARRTALIARLIEADRVTRGLSAVERVRLNRPCPLLEDGACAAYAVRPLACRAYASFDAAACERSSLERDPAAPIPVPRVNIRTRRFLSHTFRAALGERGLDGESHELNAGLLRALGIPDAAASASQPPPPTPK
jgi:Fe-S-cluster containining protein